MDEMRQCALHCATELTAKCPSGVASVRFGNIHLITFNCDRCRLNVRETDVFPIQLRQLLLNLQTNCTKSLIPRHYSVYSIVAK